MRAAYAHPHFRLHSPVAKVIVMPDEPEQEPEPTQRTPKGLEIPLPKREDVMKALRKAIKPEESPDDEKRPIVDEDAA